MSARVFPGCVLDDFSGLLCAGEAAELGVARATEFDDRYANSGHILAQFGGVAVLDLLTLVVRLASDGQDERDWPRGLARPRNRCRLRAQLMRLGTLGWIYRRHIFLVPIARV